MIASGFPARAEPRKIFTLSFPVRQGTGEAELPCPLAPLWRRRGRQRPHLAISAPWSGRMMRSIVVIGSRLPCCPPVNLICPPATCKKPPCNAVRDRVCKCLIYITLVAVSRSIFNAESIFHPDFALPAGGESGAAPNTSAKVPRSASSISPIVASTPRAASDVTPRSVMPQGTMPR